MFRFPKLKLPPFLQGRLSGEASVVSDRVAKAAPAALLIASGAGAALWWWTQWARGRAESEAASADASPTEDWTGPEG